MAQVNLGRVKGDPFTYEDFTPEQLAALKGADGVTPTIKVGTVSTLEPEESATVTASTSGTTTTFNFGIPRGENSDASIFNGTKAEYEAQKNTIEDGTVVNITDDLSDGELIGVDTLNRIADLEDETANLDTKKANKSDILTTIEQITANTNTEKLAGASAVKELSDSLEETSSNLGILFNIYNPNGRLPTKNDANQVLQSDNLKPYYINSANGDLNLPQDATWGILINYIVAYAPNYVIMQVLFSNIGTRTRNLIANIGWSDWTK